MKTMTALIGALVLSTNAGAQLSLPDGQPVSIADFRGEKVVLHVFASW